MFKLTLDIHQIETSKTGDGKEVIIDVIDPTYIVESEDLNEVINERNRILSLTKNL